MGPGWDPRQAEVAREGERQAGQGERRARRDGNIGGLGLAAVNFQTNDLFSYTVTFRATVPTESYHGTDPEERRSAQHTRLATWGEALTGQCTSSLSCCGGPPGSGMSDHSEVATLVRRVRPDYTTTFSPDGY